MQKRISPSNRAHLEFFVATVEQQRREVVPESEIARILAGLESPDERERAQAVRAVCPCRMPWSVFQRLRKDVARLRRDPSPLVRANALHVEEDARTVRDREATVAYLHERDEQEEERTAKRRKGRGVRSYL